MDCRFCSPVSWAAISPGRPARGGSPPYAAGRCAFRSPDDQSVSEGWANKDPENGNGFAQRENYSYNLRIIWLRALSAIRFSLEVGEDGRQCLRLQRRAAGDEEHRRLSLTKGPDRASRAWFHHAVSGDSTHSRRCRVPPRLFFSMPIATGGFRIRKLLALGRLALVWRRLRPTKPRAGTSCRRH